MNYHLAQVNIGKFRLPHDDPINDDFINSLDRVNAVAETQPGFVWRFTGAGNDALDVHAFNDPLIAINISVWSDIESLKAFTYRNKSHTDMFHRRKTWFEQIDFHLALWWIEEGQRPTVQDAKSRLDHLRKNGASSFAFTFKEPYAAPINKG
ncbi:MAG: DUF3291 domain-containing protein [Chloroflexota bacterium]